MKQTSYMLKGGEVEQLAFKGKRMTLLSTMKLCRYEGVLHAKMFSKSMAPHDNRNMTFIHGS